MTFQKSSYTRDFPLDKAIAIPKRIVEYKRDGRVLFVATTKASYINVGPVGAEFVRLFEQETALGEALSIVCSKHPGEKRDEIIASLSDLLQQVETRKFYEAATIVDDTHGELSMLARLTERCNLRCTHCLMSSAPEFPIDHDLDKETWFAILEQYVQFVAKNGFRRPRVTFTGGEALMRRDSLEIARYARSLGAYAELFTNGVLIVNQRTATAIAESIDEVQVSLDGATAGTHDAIRGAGMFERTIRGLKLLHAAGVKFRIATVVMPQNYGDLLNNLVPLVHALGDHFNVHLSLATEEGRATQSMQFASTREGEEKLRTLLSLMVEAGIRPPRKFTPNFRASSCGYCREITIGSNGIFYPCGPRKFPVGDLKTESFQSIAERALCMSREAEIDQVEGCRDCDLRYVCGGVCRLNNLAKTGKSNITSCDSAEKSRRIALLFDRAAVIVPISVLSNTNAKENTNDPQWNV